ncbi:MAG: hypothetical protein AAFX58_12650, partial [Pseudomonadota bacterium]
MKNYSYAFRGAMLCAFSLLASACGDTDERSESPPGAETASARTAETQAAGEQLPSIAEQVDGLWMYTGLTTSDGTDLPLTGVFLFKDGHFVQQAVFDSGPFEAAGSMAHAGPATPEPATGSVHLVAEQTISIAPEETPALSYRRDTEHDVTVSRSGDALTLIFGMGTGTVQEFRYVGPGAGELYRLQNGALAFVDGYFVLVDGSEESVTTGYGTFEKQ